MTIKTYMFKITSLFLAILCITSSAYAHDYAPNRKKEKPNRSKIEAYGYTGIISIRQMGLEFIHKPGQSSDDIYMHIVMNVPMEGCLEILPFEVKEKTFGRTKQFDVKPPIAVKSVTKKQNHYSCNDQNNLLKTELRLSRSELEEKNIRQLKVNLEPATMAFDVYLTDEMIDLKSTSNPLISPETYWFLPKNTVVLQVSMLDEQELSSPKVLTQIAHLAESKGLTPIEDSIPNYTPYKNRVGRYYFTDKRQDTIKSLENTPVIIGNIVIEEEFFGPNGKYMREKPIQVYAQKPDIND